MRFKCNAMIFVCFVIRYLNEGLNEMVCYALVWNVMRFEQKHLRTRTSSKHFEVRSQNLPLIYNVNIQFLELKHLKPG